RFGGLAGAITVHVVGSGRAGRIQRSLTWRCGRQSACGSLRDAPAAAVLAGRSQPELQACDLSAGRSRALIRASREVAAGRVDLADHEPAWMRLRTIGGIGAWTLEQLAFHGQGRGDPPPAGGLACSKTGG